MVSQLVSSYKTDIVRNKSSQHVKARPWYQELDLGSIAEKYSTPLYICNQAQIIRNFQAFLRLVEKPENILFPVKANPCLYTLRTLAQEGIGADCASAHEIELAKMSGIPSQRISYYSPTPDLALAASLLSDGGRVVIDCSQHLEDLAVLIGTDRLSGKLFLRVNPSFNINYHQPAEYQRHTSHGDPFSQFGYPMEDVLDLLKETQVPIVGLHVHVGTQMDNLEVFVATIRGLHQLCDQVNQETLHEIKEINLGGGLGVAGSSKESFPSIHSWVETLTPYLKGKYRYFIEPGNALINNATALLSKVLTRKETRGKGWALIDAGSNQLTKVTLAGFSQEIMTETGQILPNIGSDAVAGPLCFAGDIILANTDLTGVEQGDYLLLPNTGSYCRAVGNHFNGKSEPGILWVNDQLEIGMAYQNEDLFWEPSIQSFRPFEMPDRQGNRETFYQEKVKKLRSVYLNQQCKKDDYRFHHFTRTAHRTYEVEIEVDSLVAFISAPLVMRIISDAAVVAYLDSIGKSEKDISVWGSRFTLSIESILRTNHRHTLKIYLCENSCGKSGKEEVTAFWELGKSKRCYGSIKILG